MTENKQSNVRVDASIVLPAHNEASHMENAVSQITAALQSYGCTYEIIIAEDGSTDGSDKMADKLSETVPYVRVIHGQKRLGRGRALNATFKKSNGNILVYMDVDLATDIRHLSQLIASIKTEGFDLATGSRLMPQSKVQRSGTRQTTSEAYNFLVRLVLHSKIRDHQCGFKAFRREPLFHLLDEVQAKHWFWDTEILVRAQREGYRVKEIPVEWKSGSDTRVNVLKDSWNMFWQVIHLWWTLNFNRQQSGAHKQK
jgi:glycosyltransferase AglD